MTPDYTHDFWYVGRDEHDLYVWSCKACLLRATSISNESPPKPLALTLSGLDKYCPVKEVMNS